MAPGRLPALLGCVLAWAAWGSSGRPAAAPLHLTVGGEVLFTVSDAFVSYTIDSAAVCSKGWTFPSNVDDVTIARVKLLSYPGLVIRFGGTSADNEQFRDASTPLLPRLPTVANGGLGKDGCNITAAQWRDLAAFAASVNASLVYGIDSLLRKDAQPEGAIDLRNANGLLDLAASDPSWLTAGLGYELGNEPLAWFQGHYTNLTPAAHAADFAPLRRSIATTFKGKGKLPLTIGPDVYGLTKRGGAATTYLTDFLAARPAVDIVTIHLYSLMDGHNLSAAIFSNSTRLDVSRQSASAARAIVDAAPDFGPSTPLWVGEGSPSWQVVCDGGCGALGSNITFELAYLDQLGSFASSGVSLFARQCLNSVINPQTDHSGGVTPGFWSGILWKKLMGNAALNVSAAAGFPAGIRAYAHSTPPALGAKGGTTLMLLNLNAVPAQVSPSWPARACATDEAHRYTLSAGPETRNCSSWGDCGATVLLNGKTLSFASKDAVTLPSLEGVASGCKNVALPPHTVTWLVVAGSV